MSSQICQAQKDLTRRKNNERIINETIRRKLRDKKISEEH